nr:hypothetical protein [Polyangiaceae bacterium]
MGPRALPPEGALPRRLGRSPTALVALASLALALSCTDADPGAARPGARAPSRRVAAPLTSARAVAGTPLPARLAPPPLAASPPSAMPAAPSALPSEPAPAEPAPEAPPAPRLLALRKEAWVHAAPDAKSSKLGYLRAGATVERGDAPVGRKGCREGWYAVQPRGFVCVSAAASLSLEQPVAELTRRRPDRGRGLPYEYVLSTSPSPPFYLRLPSVAEQRSIEGDVPAARESRVALASIKTASAPV